MLRTRYFIVSLYAVQLILGWLNPYRYFPISWRTSILYSSLILGFLFLSNIRVVYFSRIPLKKNNLKRIHDFYPNIYFGITLLYFCIITYVRFSLNLSLQDFRDYFFFSSESFFGLVNLPLIFLNSYCIYSIFINAQTAGTKIGNIVKLMIGFVLVNSATGGRMSILMIAMFLLVITVNVPGLKNRIYNTVSYRRMRNIALTFLIYTTIQRKIGVFNFEMLYRYFVGPIFLFDRAISDSAGLVDLQTVRYGISLSGFDWLVCAVLNGMGFFSDKLSSINVLVDYYFGHGYAIGPNIKMNAFYTVLYSWYLDWGFLAPLMLILFLVLSIKGLTYGRVKNILALLLYIEFILMYGVINNVIMSPTYALPILYFLFLQPYKTR